MGMTRQVISLLAFSERRGIIPVGHSFDPLYLVIRVSFSC